MAIICTQDDGLFNSYKEKVTFRKVIFHIKDIFKDHWNNFLNEYPNFNIRETIFYNIKRLLKGKTSSLGFDVFKCKKCGKEKHKELKTKKKVSTIYCNKCRKYKTVSKY